MAQQQQQPRQQRQQPQQGQQSIRGSGGGVTPRYQQAGSTQSTGRYGSAGRGGVQTAQGYGGPTSQQFGGQQLGGQQSMGRMGGQTMGVQAEIPSHFEDAMTAEMRQALDEFTKVEKACEWAVDQTLGRGTPEVVRVLRDVAALAEVNEKLLIRSSTVGPYAAEAFVKAANDAIKDLQQQGEPHVVETVNVIQRSIDTTQRLLQSIGWTGGPQGQQFGGQGSGQTGQQYGQAASYY